MLLREGRGGAVQAGLGMGDQLDRYVRHHPFEPPLGDEPLGEAGTGEVIRQAQAQATGDDDTRGALRQGDIARDRASDRQKRSSAAAARLSLPCSAAVHKVLSSLGATERPSSVDRAP